MFTGVQLPVNPEASDSGGAELQEDMRRRVCVLGIELRSSGRAAYALNTEPCLQLCDYYIKMQS